MDTTSLNVSCPFFTERPQSFVASEHRMTVTADPTEAEVIHTCGS